PDAKLARHTTLKIVLSRLALAGRTRGPFRRLDRSVAWICYPRFEFGVATRRDLDASVRMTSQDRSTRFSVGTALHRRDAIQEDLPLRKRSARHANIHRHHPGGTSTEGSGCKVANEDLLPLSMSGSECDCGRTVERIGGPGGQRLDVSIAVD